MSAATERDAATPARRQIRTVLGDISATQPGYVYAHEHLIIDSPLIADRFAHIHLDSVEKAVEEVMECKAAGVSLMVDAMPCASGRDTLRLANISQQTGVHVVGATGLHHDRYYGPRHWSNNVSASELADLFVADLIDGVDVFDYTGPIVKRSPHRAGILKVATSGSTLNARDRRNLDAVGEASVRTGAPVLTHCERGQGGLEQVARLYKVGVPTSSIILSHVDKNTDAGYLLELASTGAVLELDQLLKNWALGEDSPSIRTIAILVDEGYGDQLVVGTDGARRTLWVSLGGTPGLAWLGRSLPGLLRSVGLQAREVDAVLRDNALRALAWRGGPHQHR